ncbi:MAG: exosome complex RNA-binding protein Rrp4 [Thermoprotei archaeon]
MKLKILVADRQIVRPGDVLAIIEDEEYKLKYFPEKHVYIMGNRVYSDILGIANISNGDVSVIPLEGTYIPRPGDLVIGVISGVGITSWVVDIRSPYKGILNGSEVIENFNPIIHNLRDYLDVGDYILAKVASFDRTRDPILTVKGKELGKITRGVIIEVKPSRVPRIIGKKGSMLSMLTNMTQCSIVVGQNGVLWIDCPREDVLNALLEAINIINTKPHMRGLTEEVRLYLMQKLGKV